MSGKKSMQSEEEFSLTNTSDEPVGRKEGSNEEESPSLTEYYQTELDTHVDLELPHKLESGGAERNEFYFQCRQILEFHMSAAIASEELCIQSRLLEQFSLPQEELDALLDLPNLGKRIKNKLAKAKPLTVKQVSSLIPDLTDALLTSKTPKQTVLLSTIKSVMDQLNAGIMIRVDQLEQNWSQPPMEPNPDLLYQFKISLQGIEPPIWRRIQVLDCSLDTLHEHIQSAMGWENDHMHMLEIEGDMYGDPSLMDDDFIDYFILDSTKTLLSQIIPKTKKRFVIKYEYDFGDEWIHEVVFEGQQPLKKNTRYPICLEGERACPPEDIGGIWGYLDFLAQLSDEANVSDEEFMENFGPFDPENFDPQQTTKDMRKGLPDTRE